MSMTPEQQIEVIKARAEGKKIECSLRGQNSWSTSIYDFSFSAFDYRVAKNPDVVIEREVQMGACECLRISYNPVYSNLKLTFDGETGKLKSAEVV